VGHHDPASPEEERGPEGALRQRREISEPLMGNAKTPKVTRGPVDERMRRLAGARDLRPLFKVRTRRRNEMREGLGFRMTGLAKFELGLSVAALNPSGASILDLKQRTAPSNEKAGG
jgi:hypothetical protein